jgi:transposase-like protein
MTNCPYCNESFHPDQLRVERFEAAGTERWFMSFECPHCNKLLHIKRDSEGEQLPSGISTTGQS